MPFSGNVSNIKDSPTLAADTLANAVKVKGALVVDMTNPATPKWYRYDGANWVEIGASAPSVPGWALTGNALTGTERLGSTNNQPIVFISNNVVRGRWFPNGNFRVGEGADSTFTLQVAGEASMYGNTFVRTSGGDITTAMFLTTGIRTVFAINLRNAGGGGHSWFTMQLAQVLPTPNADNAGNIVGYQALNSTGTAAATNDRIAWITMRGDDVNLPGFPNRNIGLLFFGGMSLNGAYADVVLQWDGTNNRGNVGIGARPRAKIKLDVTSTTAAFRPPRLTTAQRDAMALVAADEGAMIFNTDTKKHEGWDGTTWNAFY